MPFPKILPSLSLVSKFISGPHLFPKYVFCPKSDPFNLLHFLVKSQKESFLVGHSSVSPQSCLILSLSLLRGNLKHDASDGDLSDRSVPDAPFL